MKKSFTIIALAALVMLAGCKKNEQPTGTTKLTAGIEQHKSDSKTSLDSLQINWTADDQLYVYDKDGEAPAYFILVSGAGTPTGVFEGSYNFTDENVAVYPISCMYMVDNKSLQINLPATQTASGSGSFGNGANPMLGVFSDINDFTLTSLCGVLCLQLTGDNVDITAIEIEGGAADMLSGRFKINDYTNPALNYLENGTNKVTLNFTEKVTLTAMPQKFYVVLPPVHLTGLTMNVYNNADIIFTQSTTTSFTAFDITANHVETMFELDVVPTPAPTNPEGSINGLYSVSATQQVYFSKGNLQYIGSASTPYWKFADNQWDYLGTTTGQNGTNQNVDRDLFGWGTSGWNNGNTYYMPYNTAVINFGGAQGYGYGPTNGTSYLYDLTGDYAEADWAWHNAISNGGDAVHQWRTLTKNEWNYVFNERTTTSGIRYAKAIVNNVKGIILLPDDWNTATYALNNTNTANAHYASNNITATDWTDVLEDNGAVFLPAADYRNKTDIQYVNFYGLYWSSSHLPSDTGYAYCLYLSK